MICGTPVIGKIPNLKPEWMQESNGLWISQTNELIDVIANFTQNWLEDNIAETLYENMSVTGKEYQNEENFKNSVLNLFNEYS